jgi:5'-methylthioadenosine nucleosidase
VKLIITLIVTLFSMIFYTLPLHAKELNQNKVNKILLVVAMEIEASPIIKKLHLQNVPNVFSGLPMQGYVGKYANKDIFLITNGKDPMHKVDNIATQPAALATYLGIEHFHPDLVISIGTAGGIEENGAKKNDIYVSQKIYFLDRRIPDAHTEYGMGGYVSANVDPIINEMKVKKGIVCTGNSFDLSPTDTAIILKNKCSAAEMEAASVAWVSMLMKTPMLAIKGIGDIATSKTSQQEYIDNGPFICNKIAETMKAFLDHLPNEKA